MIIVQLTALQPFLIRLYTNTSPQTLREHPQQTHPEQTPEDNLKNSKATAWLQTVKNQS